VAHLALSGREFNDAVQSTSPPPAVQRAVFAALAPLAHAMGYRATYPQLSRSLLAPDPTDVAAARAAGPVAGEGPGS